MSTTAVIIDDVLNQTDLDFIQNKIYGNHLQNNWYEIWQDHEYQSFCHVMLNLANTYYDLSDVIGYEFWSHMNTRPPGGWHYDKDEIAYHKNKIYKFPVCSIVYYPIIDNVTGGELLLNKDVIVPKVNRAVIFKPKLYHYVNEFTGTRYSMLVNPWTTTLDSVTDGL